MLFAISSAAHNYKEKETAGNTKLIHSQNYGCMIAESTDIVHIGKFPCKFFLSVWK